MKPHAHRSGRFAQAWLALAVLVPMACGSSGPEMARVKGRVTYQGKPVPKGTITFQATAPEGRNATGQIDPDGYYTLQTEEPGDGALVGSYLVAISARDEAVLDYIPKKPIPPKFLVPAKYEDPAKSGLKRAVPRGGGTMDFELTE